MGQLIEVTGRTVAGDVAAFHTDRAFTGQDGIGFASLAAAHADGGFSGDLAARLFDLDDEFDHVFVASNQVVVRRPDGWDEESLEAAATVVSQFFVFYADA